MCCNAVFNHDIGHQYSIGSVRKIETFTVDRDFFYGEDVHEHWIVVATAAVEPCWLTISCINPASIKVPPVEAPVSEAPLCCNFNKITNKAHQIRITRLVNRVLTVL